MTFLKRKLSFFCGDQSVIKRRWWKMEEHCWAMAGGCGTHAAADQGPVFWILDINWSTLYTVYIYTHTHIYIYIYTYTHTTHTHTHTTHKPHTTHTHTHTHTHNTQHIHTTHTHHTQHMHTHTNIYIYIYMYIYIYIYKLNSDLLKILLAPEVPQRKVTA